MGCVRGEKFISPFFRITLALLLDTNRGPVKIIRSYFIFALRDFSGNWRTGNDDLELIFGEKIFQALKSIK